MLTLPLRNADFAVPFRSEHLTQIMSPADARYVAELEKKAEHLAHVMTAALTAPAGTVANAKSFATMCSSLPPVLAMASECQDPQAAAALQGLCDRAEKSAWVIHDSLHTAVVNHCLTLLEVGALSQPVSLSSPVTHNLMFPWAMS